MHPRKSYFRNAEGIRGLACLIVLLLHCLVIFYPNTFQYLSGAPKIGVWLFFILSAFLLTNHLLIGELSREKMGDYALGRMLRIIPLYLVAVIGYRIFGTAGIQSASNMLDAAILKTGFAHLWTIPVEMKFYALLAIIIIPTSIIYRRMGSWPAIILVTAAALLALYIFPSNQTAVSSIQLRWYLPCFLTGVTAAIAYPMLPPAKPWMCAALNVTVLGGLVLATNYFRVKLGGSPDPQWLMDKFVPIGIAWAAFVTMNVDRSDNWMQIWNFKALKLIGRWSYSIYLFHWYVVVKIAGMFPQNPAAMVLAFGGALLLGACMYALIELPCMRLRKRIFHSQQSSGITAAFS